MGAGALRFAVLRRCLVLLCVGVVLIGIGRPYVSAQEYGSNETAVDALLVALEASLASVNSGKGEAAWRISEEAPGEPGRVVGMKCAFMFKGDKYRADRVFDLDKTALDGKSSGDLRSPSRDVFNGAVTYEYRLDQGRGEHNIYMRAGDRSRGSELTGERPNVKALMSPSGTGVDGVRRALAKDPDSMVWYAVESISQGDDALIVVSLAAFQPGTDVEQKLFSVRYCFDPEKGYNITREEVVVDGESTVTIERTFEQYTGIWFLKSLNQTMLGLTRMETQIEMLSFEPNLELDDTLFELKGIGAPSTARLWDRIAGVDYEIDPTQATVAVVSKLEDYAAELPPVNLIPEGASGADSPAPETDGASAETAPPDVVADHSGWGVVRSLSVLLLVVVAAAVVLLIRRKAGKTS